MSGIAVLMLLWINRIGENDIFTLQTAVMTPQISLTPLTRHFDYCYYPR